jgi:cytochrome oxidase assembly protein ShyY1
VLGFLLSRRWLLFGLAVVLLGLACWRLGEWQFHRLEERRTDNAIIERNLAAQPVDAREVLQADEPLPRSQQWRSVTLSGEYDVRNQVLVRYQTRDGQPGVSVVTPLVMDDGSEVLVERGWVRTANSGAAEVDAPEPPPGPVRVEGWARPDQSGDTQAITPRNSQVRLISSAGFADVLEPTLLRGYVSASRESPEPAEQLQRPEPPELNSGPHFFYGLQWWFFGALAVGGFVYFAYAEARDRRRAR